MTQKNKDEFNLIVKDILNHERFIELKSDLHHGISRYEHCIRVARLAYFLSKKFNLDYERVTRGALLHDFYTDNDTLLYSKEKTLKVHPLIAKENALKYFHIDTMQQDIIATHMFPITKSLPKYKESYLVSIADKIVALKEMSCYKTVRQFSVLVLFIFNMITIHING